MKPAAKDALKVHKTGIKRRKNPIPDMENAITAQPTDMPLRSDRERLSQAANLLLDHLEVAIRQHAPRSEKAGTAREEKMKALFGVKNSCMENLVELSNLMLKIEKAATPEAPLTAAYSEPLAMNEADMALLDNFVARVRADKTT